MERIPASKRLFKDPSPKMWLQVFIPPLVAIGMEGEVSQRLRGMSSGVASSTWTHPRHRSSSTIHGRGLHTSGIFSVGGDTALQRMAMAPQWCETVEGREMCEVVRPCGGSQGYLDLPGHDTLLEFKVLVQGQAGVGKTALVANLCRLPIPRVHMETLGTQVTYTHWPIKMASGRVVIVRLKFWETGASSGKKYEYLMSAAHCRVNAMLYAFSMVDRASFDELESVIDDPVSGAQETLVKVTVGTKNDLFYQRNVSEKELQSFARAKKVPLFRVASPHSCTSGQGSDTIGLLNGLCERLLQANAEDVYRVLRHHE